MNEPAQNAVVPLNERAREIVAPALQEIATSLPANVTPEKFQAAFVTAAINDPKIIDMNPASIRAALLKCAADGLVPDGRQAAIVNFGGKAQYQPMVKGIINKAAEMGDAFSITAEVIRANDTFHADMSDPSVTSHTTPGFDEDERGEIVAAYVIFRAKDQTVIHREIMSRKEIDKAREVSRMKNAGPWRDWYSEMARKTVIRRGSKYVPMSEELRVIVERDDAHVEFKDVTPENEKNAYVDRLEKAKGETNGADMDGFDPKTIDGEITGATDVPEKPQGEQNPPETDTPPEKEPETPSEPETEIDHELIDGLKEGLNACKTVAEVTELCKGYEEQVNAGSAETKRTAKVVRNDAVRLINKRAS